MHIVICNNQNNNNLIAEKDAIKSLIRAAFKGVIREGGDYC